MKKKKSITDLVKETPEQRKERLDLFGNRYYTRIVKDKTKYDRKKEKRIEEE